MKTLFIAFKGLVNFLLFTFYSLIFIIASNFVFWLVLNFLWRNIPSGEDPIHFKMALLVIFLTLLVTLLYRKFFYLNVFNTLDKTNFNKKNDNIKKNNFKEEELEIYVNKEIK